MSSSLSMTNQLSSLALSTGVRLQYAERGSGPAVVLLHGYSDSWFSFEPVLDHLPKRMRALALTQRGHGDSERPTDGYHMSDFARDAVACLDALGIERAAFVGHSMGSLIAQEIALAHPTRVSHLVLIGSSPTGDNPVVTELAAAVATLEDPINRAFVHEFQASTVYRPLKESFLAAIVNESMKMPALVWKNVIAGLRAYDATARLSQIAAPTLVVWGDKDTVFDRAAQDVLVQGIPGAKLSVYADTGHGLHWEQPKRFADELAAFVGF